MAADNADVLAADNADVLAADTTDVLAADNEEAPAPGGLQRFLPAKTTSARYGAQLRTISKVGASSQ